MTNTPDQPAGVSPADACRGRSLRHRLGHQHAGRLTGNEQHERAAVALAEGPAQVTHLLPADSPEAPAN